MIHGGDAQLQCRQDIGERLAVGVVEMDGEPGHRHFGGDRSIIAWVRRGVPTPMVSPSDTS